MCEYCRTKLEKFSGDIISDNPKSIVCEGNGVYIDACILTDSLHINVDVDTYNTEFGEDTANILWTATGINYCPMCGRRLKQ